MYTFWSNNLATLQRWRQQRFGHVLFVPVALTLVAASTVGADLPLLWVLGIRVFVAWIAVLALRLWDDLEDRDRDRQHHPERVLTQAGSIRPYAFTVAALLGLAGFLTWRIGPFWSLPLLVGALMVFYRLKGQTRLGGEFAVLLKYPALVLVLGGSWQPAGLVAMAIVLVGVSLDELAQRSAKGRPIRGGLLATTLIILLLCNTTQFEELFNAVN